MENCEAISTCAVAMNSSLMPSPSAFASSRGAWPLVVHDARGVHVAQEGSQVSPCPPFWEGPRMGSCEAAGTNAVAVKPSSKPT
eukprot:104437-Alexandrium_andersonii.AAC.1